MFDVDYVITLAAVWASGWAAFAAFDQWYRRHDLALSVICLSLSTMALTVGLL